MSSPCSYCNKTSFIGDDVSGELICSSCGGIQQFDQFDAQIGAIDGPQGTFIRVGTAGSGSLYSFKERKLFAAQTTIEEVTYTLGLSSKSVDVRSMASTITEGEFGQGEWFRVLIGACAYVVMRREDQPLPMAEVASAVGCDLYEIGRSVVFESEDSEAGGVFDSVCGEVVLSTGRRPLPLVVAVVVFVAELNGIAVEMEELAREVLPWGKDVTVKNIVKNAPFVIQYLERKAMLKPGVIQEKRKDLHRAAVDLEDVVAKCLRHDDELEYGVDGVTSRKDLQYFSSESKANRLGVGDADRLQVSPECLSVLYKKFLDENRCAEPLRGSGNALKRRSFGFDLQQCTEWWDGKSELSKKLLLKHLLEKDIGVETMLPSFVNGQLKCKMRQDRINAAKLRIKRIMHPFGC
ncbi:unnamed protein product [Sphenostylis stenocarpa]|uniref:TFIIB-type domain-containing protein n=1 Tax=Sphenostylis stenocarpa TaxID=92480 RepID=A0AA86S3K4_9FABA|nr:unnamed protein product [Sphenostylis stenocarpa]